MPDVYEQAAIFRRELDALDRKAARQMQESYRDAYRVMQARLQAMTNLIEAKKAAGEPVEGRWLFQQERWRQFYSSLRDEIEAYGKIARGITVDAQGKAIEMGQAHTAGLIKSALGKDPHEPIGFAFNKPADKVLRQMVGFAANGLPLSERWGPIAEEARALALKTMQRGVLIGQNPYVLAREMQGPLGVPLWRSMTIARTETLRAYRESQRQTVLANTDILEGWVWHSAKDPRTCEVCWAMDGKLFPIGGGPDTAGHVMASGPAPRQAFVPAATQAEATARFKASGLFAEAPDWAKGKEGWFEGLKLHERNEILREWERLQALGVRAQLTSTGIHTDLEIAHVVAGRMMFRNDVDWADRIKTNQYMLDPTIAGTFRHEFAHVIEGRFGVSVGDKSGPVGAFVDKLLSIDVPEIPAWGALRQDERSRRTEIFAEYASHVMSPGYRRGSTPLDDEFFEMLRKAGLFE